MTYTADQLDLLVTVQMDDHPIPTARAILYRWDYIGRVARAARMGITIDQSLKTVASEPDRYIKLADETCSALREFLQGQQPQIHKTAS